MACQVHVVVLDVKEKMNFDLRKTITKTGNYYPVVTFDLVG